MIFYQSETQHLGKKKVFSRKMKALWKEKSFQLKILTSNDWSPMLHSHNGGTSKMVSVLAKHNKLHSKC